VLLRFVAGDLHDVPVLILGCYRDTEVGPELAETLAELARDPAVDRIALKGLSGPDISQLLPGAGDDLVASVHAETEGNPLFATEIARLIEAEGTRPMSGTRLRIPEGVSEAIGRRLGRQSQRCRDVLTVASVIGRDFDADIVALASERDEDGVLRALEEAVDAQLVADTGEGGGRLRFSHILVRDTLYNAMGSPRRARLHRAVAAALESRWAANIEPHLAELAHHYLEGGPAVADKALAYVARAGDRAAAQMAYEEAARHYATALEVIETTASAEAGETGELLVSLGEALSRAGSATEAKEALRRAAGVADREGRADLLARAALEYGGRFAWARAGSDPALVPLLQRALTAVGPGDSTERVRLLGRLAGALRDEPLVDHRTRLAEEAVEMAGRLGDPATLAFALEGHFIAVEGPDNPGMGVELGARLVALGEEIGDQERVFAGHDHLSHSVWQMADRPALDVELDTLSRVAGELRQPSQRWAVGTCQTMLALMEGRLADAERLIRETKALGEPATGWNATVTERIALFVLRREQCRLGEVEETIRRSVHEYPALLRFRCALAHLYAETGNERGLRAVLDDLLARDLAREHRDAEWTFSIALLADPCAVAGDTDAAARLYTLLLPCERLYAQAPVEAVFGAAARGLGVLAAVLERWDDAERHFEVAMEIERDMRARPWLAHVQHDLARMLRARGSAGDGERADELVQEAAGTFRELGMETWAERAAVV
jgi:tetratricopeptide (TPR) repeat protein